MKGEQMKEQIERVKAWKGWAEAAQHSWIYKLLVLLGIEHSPSFEAYRALKRFTDDVVSVLSKGVREITEREQNEKLE